MSRDANQIAQEYGRQHAFEPHGGGPATNTANSLHMSKPNRGTFRVWKDGDLVNEESDKFDNVTVELGVPGMIRLGMDHGTMLIYPQPGWYCEFHPNDEGE